MNKIYVHSKNILSNYKYLKSLQPNAELFPVLKSNAYGHGLEIVAKILNKTDAPYIVVDSFPEYQIVKDNSKKKILVL
jgi:alanine racemase